MKTTMFGSAVLALLASITEAHMQMVSPPPFRSKWNPSKYEIDNNMNFPLFENGTNYPCKGYHSILGSTGGESVATWTPGGRYSATFIGAASHGGGSCQLSLSMDKGKTFKVIHSFIGGCVVPGEGNNGPPDTDPTNFHPVALDFTLPSDTPSGTALFAWTWFNRIGNREMYMNCAAVTIAGKSKKRRGGGDFNSRPEMFVANVQSKACEPMEGLDLKFPDPGPDVTVNSKAPTPMKEEILPKCVPPTGGKAPAEKGAIPAAQPSGKPPAGQPPAGQAPAGQAPAGQAPAGQAPAGQAPAGKPSAQPAAPAPTGTAPGGGSCHT